jgi:hypothetical protein
MKKILFLLSVALFSISCEEEISVLTLDNSKPVITGYLYAGQLIDSIRITESISYTSDGALKVIDGLNVMISNDEAEFELNSIGAGYYSHPNHIVQEGMTYKISFEYNDEQILATTYVNPKKTIKLSESVVALEKIEFDGSPGRGGLPEQKVIDITWDNAELDYYFTIVEHTDKDPEYVNGIFEFLADNDFLPERFFRSEPEITDVHSINSTRELQFFGNYDITVFRLNPEYAALYESIGSSTISLKEPPSNVQNGLGVFTAVTPHYLTLKVVRK